jgi:hypothetical protein
VVVTLPQRLLLARTTIAATVHREQLQPYSLNLGAQILEQLDAWVQTGHHDPKAGVGRHVKKRTVFHLRFGPHVFFQ